MSSRTPRNFGIDVLQTTNFESMQDSISLKFDDSDSKFDSKIESHSRGECGDCGLRGREIALHIATLEAKLSDEAYAKNRLSSSLSEYEKQILEKDVELEKLRLEKQEIEFELNGLKKQLEITTKHLDTMEISFNDVHEKYERGKQTIQILNKNVETLKKSIEEHDLCINQKHEQFLMLKEHAMERMDFANSQLDLIERKYSLETSKLRTALGDAELNARSLSEQLEQRRKDNAELTSICDGLIEKLDSQKNNNIIIPTMESGNRSIDYEKRLRKLRF